MDLTQGALWGFRLFLFRDPRDDAELDGMARGATGAEDLRARFIALPEYQNLFATIGAPPQGERYPIDLREGLVWTARYFLRRELTQADIDHHLPHIHDLKDLRRVFFSRESEEKSPDTRRLQDLTVLHRFAPFASEPAPEGMFRNFIGTATRTEFLPPVYADRNGRVEGAPGVNGAGMHGVAEWVGTLRAALEAADSGRNRLTVIELGAGWAPWLVASAFAARRLGITDVRLAGVEGSDEHYAYMRRHFEDNGLDPDAHRLLHAVIGTEDGIARFPRLHVANLDYGANAVFEDGETDAAKVRGDLEEIRCVGLPGLLAEMGETDLLHVDIQGHEQAVLTASIETMNQRVRRVVVGTHSRAIEAVLLDLFTAHGWYLEFEVPCALIQLGDGSLYYPVDGEQVWKNPRL